MEIKHTLRALRHRNYRLFFCGQTLSIIGNWVQQIAMAWLVYRLTESAWLLGVTGFAGQIAILLLAPFGGVWADRFDRHRLLLLTQAFSILPPLVLSLLAYADLIAVWHVVAMALLAGIINAIDTPIRLTFTTGLVSREELPSAIAMNALMQSLGRMIGPTVAGGLLAVSTEAFCFVVNTLSKLVIVGTVLAITVSARTAGFNALDIGALSSESLALHYMLMFIGGGSAGTAGGVKVTTFFVLVLVVWNEVRGHRDVEFRGRRIADPVQRQAISILVLSTAAVALALLLMLPLTPQPLEKVLFEVISAFGTVGLSAGIAAELPPGALVIVTALMFIGRVGVVTLAVALATNQLRRNYRYPEEKPIVG